MLGHRWDERVCALLSVTFLLTASFPGTIALRYLLLALSLGVMLLARRDTLGQLWRDAKWPSALLLLFVLYAAWHCATLSNWPAYAWGEFRSQILVGLGWFVAGWGLFRRQAGWSILDRVILAGAGVALAELGCEVWAWHQTGAWPFMVTFTTATHLEFTFWMNIVLAFVLVAICFARSEHGLRSRFPVWLLLAIAVLIVFVSLRAGARNGMIGLIYLCFSLLAIFLLFERQRIPPRALWLLVLIIPLGLMGLGHYTYKQDTRNQVLVGSLQAGWNYQNSTAWYDDGPLPFLADGRQADDSAYKRLAWFHRGLDLIRQHPLGLGYGRGAFGRALLHEGYPNRAVAHSHSGLIDLGVGLGLPAILLWFAYCGWLVLYGGLAFARRRDLLGLVLTLVSCGFMGRMVIESVQRDHMLYLFLFITAALLAEMAARATDAPSPRRPT